MRQSNVFIAFVVLASAVVLGFYGVTALAPTESVRETEDLGRVYVPLKRPTVSFGNPSIGPKDAPVTVFSFGDYQCAPCAQMNATLVELRKEFPEQVRVVWKDMPDESKHVTAVAAANAARCAGDQGKFWEYHAILMEQNGVLVEANFPVYASQLGLDGDLFGTCLTSERNVPLVERDVLEGRRLNIQATPTVFIGEQRATGARDISELRTYVTAEIDRASQSN
jgi:protein-disulfide isomerase